MHQLEEGRAEHPGLMMMSNNSTYESCYCLCYCLFLCHCLSLYYSLSLSVTHSSGQSVIIFTMSLYSDRHHTYSFIIIGIIILTESDTYCHDTDSVIILMIILIVLTDSVLSYSCYHHTHSVNRLMILMLSSYL